MTTLAGSFPYRVILTTVRLPLFKRNTDRNTMNQALIDNSILAASFIAAFLLVKFNAKRKSGAVASFLLVFAPLVIFLNMWGHTVAVLIVNYKRYVGGVFQYNFNFYALILFGVVFILVSGINIDRARKLINGDVSQKSTLHWLNSITALLFLPMVFLNPIASLPVIASALSSGTLFVAKDAKEPSHARHLKAFAEVE